MSFTRRQQGLFRPLVQRAWKRHCTANAVPLRDKAEGAKWYRAELLECLGVDSTKNCDQRGDFEKVMAHFEAILGDDIYWQMRLYHGDGRRILHTLNAYCTGHDIDDDYMRRIARQALKTDILPELNQLKADDLLTILRALKIYVRRRLLRDDPNLTPGPDAPEWAQWGHAAKQAAANPAPVEISEEQPF